MSAFNRNTRRIQTVLRCPTAAEYGGYDQGGLTSLRLWRITSSPSQTLRRRLMQTTDDGHRGECSTLAAVRCGFVFHTSRLVRLTTLDLYAAKPDIRPESRFLPTPPAFDAPVRGGGSRRNITTPFGTGKLEWCGYPMVKKFRRYVYSF